MNGQDRRETVRDRLEQLEAAAIDAERSTGAREETVAEAKRHILVRLGRAIAGVVVVLVGIALLPLPGPGTLTIIAGLALRFDRGDLELLQSVTQTLVRLVSTHRHSPSATARDVVRPTSTPRPR